MGGALVMGALLGPKLCPQESSVRASPSIQALGDVAGGARLRTLGTASHRVCQLLTRVPWALRSPEHHTAPSRGMEEGGQEVILPCLEGSLRSPALPARPKLCAVRMGWDAEREAGRSYAFPVAGNHQE